MGHSRNIRRITHSHSAANAALCINITKVNNMNKQDVLIIAGVGLFLATLLFFRLPPFDGGYVADFCKTEYLGNPDKVLECINMYEEKR